MSGLRKKKFNQHSLSGDLHSMSCKVTLVTGESDFISFYFYEPYISQMHYNFRSNISIFFTEMNPYNLGDVTTMS